MESVELISLLNLFFTFVLIIMIRRGQEHKNRRRAMAKWKKRNILAVDGETKTLYFRDVRDRWLKVENIPKYCIDVPFIHDDIDWTDTACKVTPSLTFNFPSVKICFIQDEKTTVLIGVSGQTTYYQYINPNFERNFLFRKTDEVASFRRFWEHNREPQRMSEFTFND